MTEILAVFRSRAQAADCNAKLKMNGIAATLINTPKEANVGCGLSVILPQNTAARAKQIILGSKYSAFYGFFAMKTVYGRTFLGRIN